MRFENNHEMKGHDMMNKIACWCVAVLLGGAVCGRADDEGKAREGSPEFERMKTLVGAWKGKTDMGQGPIDITVRYRLLAGGSVLEERVFEGAPNEMVTMY